MPDAQPDIVFSVDKLTRRFGDLTAVEDLSFSIYRGEVFGFLGPNGAGKTTAMRMMCGLLKPHDGSIEINGQPLNGGDWKGLRCIGVCPQAITIWETMTCREQLEFMGRMYDLDWKSARRRSRELLDVFGLQDKTDRLGRTLSGGMQRRLNIALALVHDPEILFLDEPQAGLDPQSRILVREYLKTLSGKTTVVLTTHDMEEAEKISDRVCIIDGGKKLVLDTVETIKGDMGQGDLFAIEISEDLERDLIPHLPERLEESKSFYIVDRTLNLVSDQAVDILPGILQTIKDQGLHLESLRIRKKTLEDVFIRLTGRGLRE